MDTEYLESEGAGGKFFLRRAVMLFPEVRDDSPLPRIRTLIHELAHALTLCGSRAYAYYATELLSGGNPSMPGTLLEAVPSALKELGGRHSAGTLAAAHEVQTLVSLVQAYRDRFRANLPEVADSDRCPPGTAGHVAELTGRHVFDKTVVVNCVQVALTAKDPARAIGTVCEFLKAGGTFPAGVPGHPLHILRLFTAAGVNLPTRPFPVAQECRDLVNHAFKAGGIEDRLRSHLMLVPALLGVECLLNISDAGWQLSLFRSPSRDSKDSALAWAKLLGDGDQVGQACCALVGALVPSAKAVDTQAGRDFYFFECCTRMVVALPQVVRAVTENQADPQVYRVLDNLAAQPDNVVDEFTAASRC